MKIWVATCWVAIVYISDFLLLKNKFLYILPAYIRYL